MTTLDIMPLLTLKLYCPALAREYNDEVALEPEFDVSDRYTLTVAQYRIIHPGVVAGN